MLYWKDDGAIDRHELYQVHPNPIEEGNEITSDNPELAEELLESSIGPSLSGWGRT